MKIKKEESFRNWLPQNGVNVGSITSYISRLKKLEQALNEDIDKLIRAEGVGLLDRINNDNIPLVSDGTLRDIVNAVKKYCRCFYPKSKIIAKKL